MVFTISLIFFSIAIVTHAEEVVINKKMEAALKKFNPQFVVWEAKDYSATIQKDSVENNRHPYSIVLDANEDKKDDLVLDGHDNKNNLLICLLPTPKGYDVIVIPIPTEKLPLSERKDSISVFRTVDTYGRLFYGIGIIRRIDLLNPKEIEVFNDGVKEMGLNYYLWPNKKGTGFTLAYPQQSDSEGNLLNDGAMIDYIFKDGRFHESCQTL